MNAVIENKSGAVDRNKCIVYGVKVLGFNSMNGRIYDPQAIRDAVPLYENAPVNKDHKTEAPLFSDRLGWLQNVRFTPEGLYADFRYNPHADGIESFLWFAENNGLGDVGFSHLVSGKSIPDQDGTERVVRIDRVRSVDLVANPATTTTIFEGDGLWANINAKKKRGEKPAERGDEDYPDKKSWDNLTNSNTSKESIVKNDKMMVEENPVKEMYKEEVPDVAPTEAPVAAPTEEEPASDMLKKIMDICVGPGEGSAKGKMILDLIAAATGLGVGDMAAETTDVTGTNKTQGTPAQANLGDEESGEEEMEEEKKESIDELLELRKWKAEKLNEEKILSLRRESKLEPTPVFVKQLSAIGETMWAEAIEDRKKVALVRASVKPVSSTAIQGESNYQQFRENVLGK